MFIYVYTCVAYALDCSSCLSIDNCFLNKTKGPCFWGLIVVYLFRGIIFMFCFGWSMAAPFWILLLATATITLVTFTVIACLVWAQAKLPGPGMNPRRPILEVWGWDCCLGWELPGRPPTKHICEQIGGVLKAENDAWDYWTLQLCGSLSNVLSGMAYIFFLLPSSEILYLIS